MPTLFEETAQYQNTRPYHQEIVKRFTDYVNTTPVLKAHRDFVEQHVYGFGERSFLWMWKLLVDELPPTFRFLEIGVWKGQILSLIRLLSATAEVYGLTRLDTWSGPKGEFTKFPDRNYRQDIQDLHDHFALPMPTLIVGDSTDPSCVQEAQAVGPFDVVYVDGGHEYEVACQDLRNYAPMVKPGGFLVVDDCSNFLNMYPGSFPGIRQVSEAVRDVIDPDPQWTHLLAVMHNRVWQRSYD